MKKSIAKIKKNVGGVKGVDYIVYIFYPILVFLLLFGAKFYGKNGWNDEFMSLPQTKELQGFIAVCIVFHHLGQKTCAPWLNPEYIVHGLDLFVPIGYLLVAVFLFCSGYGMYKSYHTKENYLEGFFARRFMPLILAFLTTECMFLVTRIQRGEAIEWIPHPFTVGGPNLYNNYAWYVFALMVLYIGFYVAFRFCKNEKWAIAILGVITVGYILYCDYWIYGDWWYNTVILFVVGLLFAKHEEKVIAQVKKRYGLFAIATGILAITTFTVSNSIFDRWGRVLMQMLAAISFVAFIFLLRMKVKIGNKALAFFGSFTLELYLVHGLFVQLFGFSFISEKIKPLYYIRNVALHTLVVFAISIPLAYALHFLFKWILTFLERHKEGAKEVGRNLKKLVLAVVCIVVVMILFYAVTGNRKSRNMQETVDRYAKENITFTEVDGHKMAAYITGEGDNTIVLLSGVNDVCPTVSLKPLADSLAEQNKVIVLDNFGRGYSDDTDSERSAENLVEEVHTALHNLGVDGLYILMPYHSAGFYSQLYADTYPEEIKAVIALDAFVPEMEEEVLRIQKKSVPDYERYIARASEVTYYAEKLSKVTGFSRVWFAAWKSIFRYSTKEELVILEEMWVDNYANKNAMEEAAYEYKNAEPLFGKKYAEDMPVLFLLSYYSCEGRIYGDIDWYQIHENVISNTEKQKIEILAGTPYFVYYTIPAITEKAQEFIDNL